MADFVTVPAEVKPVAGSTMLWGKAGGTILAGDALFEDPADGLLKLCTALGTLTQSNLKGIAVAGASFGQPVPYVSAGPVQMKTSPSWAVAGAIVVVSINAGELCSPADISAGEKVTIAGFGDITEMRLIVTISRYDQGSYVG